MDFLKKAKKRASKLIRKKKQEAEEEDGDRGNPGEGGTSMFGDDLDFDTKAAEAIPGNVRMFSGCEDSQTSADVGNVASFRLPADAGPGGAGGACTNALIKTLSEKDGATWVQILDGMRDILEAKEYTQVPQLSASRKLDMSEKFSVLHDRHEAPINARC